MKSKNLQSVARSINDRLANLSDKRKISFEQLLTQFLIERMVERIVANKELSRALVFKGGYVALRVYDSPRYTSDLDALSKRMDLIQASSLAISAIEKSTSDGVWFKFQESRDLKTQSENGGIRLVFRCGVGEPLKEIRRAQIVNLDIGAGDPITPGEVKMDLVHLLGTGSLVWEVYPVETICAEKLHSLLCRRSDNSRAKDVFDLAQFLPRCDQKTLQKALENTFRYRSDKIPSDIPTVLKGIGTDLMRSGWKSAVTGVREPEDFDTTFSRLIKAARAFFNRGTR